VEYVYNEDYMDGMSTSVKKGVTAAYNEYRDDLEAVDIAPGDTAWAPPGAYDKVIEEYRLHRKYMSIFVAAYYGRRGHPILFDKSLIPEILNISEESRGLKAVTRKHRFETLVVDTIYSGVA
jgi:molybdenum cofactor cytidylyltransferase